MKDFMKESHKLNVTTNSGFFSSSPKAPRSPTYLLNILSSVSRILQCY